MLWRLADTGSRALVRRFKWDCLSATHPVRALRASRSNFGLTFRKCQLYVGSFLKCIPPFAAAWQREALSTLICSECCLSIGKKIDC